MGDTAGHYFDPEPSSASRPSQVRLDLPDRSLVLATDRGVFSGDRVDPGTKYLLLEAPPPPPEGTFVDLGCGYGPIACTLAGRAPGATVWAVDVNARALELCCTNAVSLDLNNVRTVPPEDVPADLAVDLLWSNPPIRIGKPALHDLLATWLDRLTPAGRALLVVQKHLGCGLAAALAGRVGVDRRAAGLSHRVPATRGHATVKQLDGTGMKRLHREWRRRTDDRLAVVLDDVQGPFNVGAVIRTAASLRVEDVWLAGRTPEPDDAKVGKTALGTDRYLQFHRVEDGVECRASRACRGLPRRRDRAGRRGCAAARARPRHGHLRGGRSRRPRPDLRHDGRLRRRRLPPTAWPRGVAQRRHRSIDRAASRRADRAGCACPQPRRSTAAALVSVRSWPRRASGS